MAMSEGAATAPAISNPRGLPVTTGARVHPPSNEDGYRRFEAGDFSFRRDAYFVHGRATCARCRAGEAERKRKQRELAKAASRYGVTLPREAGRRRAFGRACRQAEGHVRRRADREARSASHRSAGPGEIRVSLPWEWEGHQFTARARVEYSGNPALRAHQAKQAAKLLRMLRRGERRRDRREAEAKRAAVRQAKQEAAHRAATIQLRRDSEASFQLMMTDSRADVAGVRVAFGERIPPRSSRHSPENLVGEVEGRRERAALHARGIRDWKPSLSAILPGGV